MIISVSSTKVLHFVNIIFLCVFICHVSFIAYGLRHPPNPSVKVYYKDMTKMKDVDFPLTFKLCLRELKNPSERYQRLGYAHENDFYLGDIKPDKEIKWKEEGNFLLGWNGKNNTGSPLGTVEGPFH